MHEAGLFYMSLVIVIDIMRGLGATCVVRMADVKLRWD